MANKSRVYVVGGDGGAAGSQRTWNGFTKAEGFVDMPAGAGNILVAIPIPAGNNQGFAIKMLVYGIASDGSQATLQEVFYAVWRDDVGGLFVSTSDTNVTLRGGSGDNLPEQVGSQVNGETLECVFDNTTLVSARVHYSWTMSPPLALPDIPAPPVPA